MTEAHKKLQKPPKDRATIEASSIPPTVLELSNDHVSTKTSSDMSTQLNASQESEIKPGSGPFEVIKGTGLIVAIAIGMIACIYIRFCDMPFIEGLKSFGLIVLTFVFLGFVFWFIEMTWPEDETQEKMRAESKSNLVYLFLNFLVVARVATSFVLVGFAVFTILHIPHLPTNWITRQPKLLQLLEIAVIKDFLGYWNHRMFHEVPFLWRFHAVHHSSRKVDWLSAAREHPFESITSKMVTTLPLVLLGFAPDVLGPYVGAWTAFTLLNHANVTWSYGPFRWIIVSPAFHRWHHSSQEEALDKNYSALLPIWDYLFKTVYFPKGEYSQAYGLHGREMPEGVVEQFLDPIVYKPEAPQQTVEVDATDLTTQSYNETITDLKVTTDQPPIGSIPQKALG